MRALAFLVIVAFAIAALAISERAKPNDGLPMAHADFPECVTVHPGPIVKHRPDARRPTSELT